MLRHSSCNDLEKLAVCNGNIDTWFFSGVYVVLCLYNIDDQVL